MPGCWEPVVGVFAHISHRTVFSVPSRVLVTKGLSEGVRRVSGEVWSGETESLAAVFISKMMHKIKV